MTIWKLACAKGRGSLIVKGEQAKMVLMQMRGRGASLVAIKHKDDLNGPQVDY